MKIIYSRWCAGVKHFEDTRVIEASRDRVWALTIDIAEWPSFLTTVQRIEILRREPLKLGSMARIKQPRQLATVWTVTRFVPKREFAWVTKSLGVKMTGSHVLEDVDGSCRNTLAIDLSGPGSGVFGVLFGKIIKATIAAENACITEAAISNY
jgi:polyketide cyclase/dehydrase/lipid transport protein